MHGFTTPVCTLKRVRVWIEREFGVRYSEVHVWRLLGQLGFSNQKPDRRALERDAVAIEEWRKRTWPALKRRQTRGTTDRLRRRIRRLGAPHPGPDLGRERRNAGRAVSLQLASAVADRRHALQRSVLPPARRDDRQGTGGRVPQGAARPLAPAAAHPVGQPSGTSQPLGSRLRRLDGGPHQAALPSRLRARPQPVEFLWAWFKRHALANYCPDTFADLRHTARGKLKSAQRRSVIIASHWQQAELF